MTIPSTNTVSSDIKPRQSTCYNSSYLAEYYDFWLGEWDDTNFYSELLNHIVLQTPPSEPIVVLDIGAGSGRVIHALASKLPKGTSNVRFLGLDNEPHMLERARSLTRPAHAGQITWVLGSAYELESVPAFRDELLKANVVIFACGSICHMHEPGQGEQLFSQIAKVLKPGTGRAYISLLKVGLSDGGIAEELSIIPPTQVYWSRDFRDIIYRETEYRREMVGPVWHNTRRIVVSQVMDDGTELVVEDNINERKMRVWSEVELRKIAAGAGLKVVNIVDRHNVAHDERIFVMQLDE